MQILLAIGRFFVSRTFFVLLGLVALSAVIWFAGPLLALWGSHPLASEIHRIEVIAALFACWGLLRLLRYFRAWRANRRMIDSLVERESLASLGGASGQRGDLLEERFRQAFDTLKESEIEGGRGRNFVYQLPWYIIIGPPGSGKTTVLRNSGLEFPLAERLGVDTVQGVGGTRNCDWWFTDQAVLIDTAGRYTTQDSDADADRSAWRSFLDLLKKYRPRRPVNGILLALSVSDILNQNEREWRLHIEAIKRRLQELMRAFNMRLPVYVVLTKADLIAGFTEFFEDFDKPGREQIWGMTFPFEKRTVIDARRAFEAEFDGLLDRVVERQFARLDDESDVARRWQIFCFPQQLISIRRNIAQFLDDVFRPNRYEMNPYLRGVFLTSGTQEGTPIDRLMGGLSRTYGLAAGGSGAAQAQGKAYFIHDALTKVVFPEAELVGRQRPWDRWLVWGMGAGYAAAALAIALVTGLWLWASSGIGSRLDMLDRQIASYQSLVAQLPATGGTVADTLPTLRALKASVDSYNHNALISWVANIGLTSDRPVGQAIDDAYRRVLQTQFMPRVAEELRLSILSALDANVDPRVLHDLLADYLMLGDPAHFDAAQLERWATATWNVDYALHPALQNELRGRLDEAVAAGPISLPLDPATIGQARARLIQVPPEDQVYNELVRDAAASGGLQPLDLAAALGPDANLVLSTSRIGGVFGRIPGLYTAAGFRNYFLTRVPKLVTGDRAADWVLGAQGQAVSAAQSASVIDAVAQRYQHDYIQLWQSLLEDVQLVRFTSVPQAISSLQLLAGTRSPLNRLLAIVKSNTELPPPGAGAVAALGAATGAQPGSAAPNANRGGANALEKNWPGTPITQAFERLNSLTSGGGGTPPIIQVQNQLAGIYGLLNQVATSPDPQAAAYQLAMQRLHNSNDALSALRVQGAQLPSPVDRLMSDVAGSSWVLVLDSARDYIDAAYVRDVLPKYQTMILDRYPAFGQAQQDTQLRDFASFFGANGTMDKFFQTNLAPFVNTNGGTWTNQSVDGQSLDISAEALKSFRDAQVVRTTFFASGGQTPQINFTLTPTYLDPAAARVTFDFDNNSFSYRHEPPRPWNLQWPQKSLASKVGLSIEDFKGAANKLEFQGPWALFRFFDRVSLAGARDSDEFAFTATLGSLKAGFSLHADSVINPFDLPELQEFRCPSSL